ncbi:hypothetical protein GWK47_029567 [Chionoecetes opilio]|uniref:Uncharacterized protein n=1 Tax=Chionoecetes opilio TaxID=41210 RepID=A0A8J4Z433_CHIOP|nr:hypothetical protein GWK47_029567 [Chionoecetes opilio]
MADFLGCPGFSQGPSRGGKPVRGLFRRDFQAATRLPVDLFLPSSSWRGLPSPPWTTPSPRPPGSDVCGFLSTALMRWRLPPPEGPPPLTGPSSPLALRARPFGPAGADRSNSRISPFDSGLVGALLAAVSRLTPPPSSGVYSGPQTVSAGGVSRGGVHSVLSGSSRREGQPRGATPCGGPPGPPSFHRWALSGFGGPGSRAFRSGPARHNLPPGSLSL